MNILFKRKVYEVDDLKLVYVLGKLADREVELREARKLMRRFHLYDELFLRRVNDLRVPGEQG